MGATWACVDAILRMRSLRFTNNFAQVLRGPVFSDIIVGFALQKAQ
jgi:hypothetical protein